MGGDWITTLPDGWRLKQIRHIFRIHNGATPKSGDSEYWNGDINWITPEDLGNNDGKDIVESRRKITSEGYANSGVSLAPAGSIAISTRAPIGHLAKTLIPSCVNQGCRLLEPKEGSSDYWYYASLAAKPILVSRGQGTTFMELPRQSLASVKLPVPPDEEQQTIVRFLDFKTAQIDALIAKKKELLDKLAEKRTALISHAVTKGLDPSVPMKDSGVAWLGNIPANWDIGQFSHFIFFQEGPGIMAVDFHDSGVPLLRIHNVQNEVVSLDGCNYLDPEKVKVKWAHFRLRTGDLLISCSASTGLVSEVDSNSEGAVAYTGIIRLNAARPEISKEFIKVLVGSSLFFEQIAVLKTGTTLQHFGPAHLRRMFITLPPINEQIEIVSYIKNECSLIDAQSKKMQVAIDLLTEYRSALITNAVTGKMDVRGFEIPQPAEGIAS